MCFRPIRLSYIRLPISIMLSRLIIYHDNLADWTFSLLSHMPMSNNSLTTRRIGHYKQLVQQKVQSFQISQQFWTFYLILLLVRSNSPHFCTSQQKVDTTLYFYTSFNEHNTPYTVLESDNSESMPDVLH